MHRNQVQTSPLKDSSLYFTNIAFEKTSTSIVFNLLLGIYCEYKYLIT